MKVRNVVIIAVAVLTAVGASSPAAAQDCDKRSATGHVEFVGSVPNVNEGRHIVYSFSAIQTGAVAPDGQCVVNGEVEERLYSGIVDVPRGIPEGTLLRHSHGDVVCITTRPNVDGGHTAWIGWRGDYTDPPVPCTGDPAQCITHAGIDVEDNGEGPDDPPDRGSALFGRTEAQVYAYCAGQPNRPRGDVIRGNVQVRP